MQAYRYSFRVSKLVSDLKYRCRDNIDGNLLLLMSQDLMTSTHSPIIEYYPVDFKTDLNGKQQEWEAVVLIPFIDEVHTLAYNCYQTNVTHYELLCVCVVCVKQRCLLAAMEPLNHKLTKEEKARNQHSECALYSYDPDVDFTYTSSLPQLFPNIFHCHVR